jgi:hypothetical protein
VADSGIFRIGHQVWQRAAVTAAAAYLREVLAKQPDDQRVKALHEGLLEVLEPNRRVLRQQRELSDAHGIPVKERRRVERRTGVVRRKKPLELPEELERRAPADRRVGRDRRKP